jgi:hypothetical protein
MAEELFGYATSFGSRFSDRLQIDIGELGARNPLRVSESISLNDGVGQAMAKAGVIGIAGLQVRSPRDQPAVLEGARADSRSGSRAILWDDEDVRHRQRRGYEAGQARDLSASAWTASGPVMHSARMAHRSLSRGGLHACLCSYCEGFVKPLTQVSGGLSRQQGRQGKEFH